MSPPLDEEAGELDPSSQETGPLERWSTRAVIGRVGRSPDIIFAPEESKWLWGLWGVGSVGMDICQSPHKEMIISRQKGSTSVSMTSSTPDPAM